MLELIWLKTALRGGRYRHIARLPGDIPTDQPRFYANTLCLMGTHFELASADELAGCPQCMVRYGNLKRRARRLLTATMATHSTHGVDCVKFIHDPNRTGYLHDAQDDSPYDVDGVPYCGRCHRALV